MVGPGGNVPPRQLDRAPVRPYMGPIGGSRGGPGGWHVPPRQYWTVPLLRGFLIIFLLMLTWQKFIINSFRRVL